MSRLFIPLLAAVLLQACAAVGDSKKTISLDKTLYFYESAMRWGDFPAADSLRRSQDPAAPGNDPEKLARIKVTGYDTLSSSTADDENTLNITVRISYYDEANLKVMSLTDEQIWRFDPMQESWYIATPLPVFK